MVCPHGQWLVDNEDIMLTGIWNLSLIGKLVFHPPKICPYRRLGQKPFFSTPLHPRCSLFSSLLAFWRDQWWRKRLLGSTPLSPRPPFSYLGLLPSRNREITATCWGRTVPGVTLEDGITGREAEARGFSGSLRATPKVKANFLDHVCDVAGRTEDR